jgi:molybdate transport repressor ModE-like protein
MLDARRLRALRAVAAHGSIAAAATSLGYTASAVSQSIAAMERYLDLQLMERTSHGVTLTEAGLRLVEHADVILAHLDAAEREARALKGQEHALALYLGSLPSAAGVVARAAAELLQRHPGAELRIVDADPVRSLPGLRSRELDVALTYAYDGMEVERPRWLQVTPLLDDPIRVALPEHHPLAGQDSVRLADLARERFIAEPRPDRRAFSVLACQAAGFSPEIAAYSSDYDVTLALVADGLGVALVPMMALRDVPGLVARRLLEPGLKRQLLAATRVGNARTPAIAALLGALRRAANAPPSSADTA